MIKYFLYSQNECEYCEDLKKLLDEKENLVKEIRYSDEAKSSMNCKLNKAEKKAKNLFIKN